MCLVFGEIIRKTPPNAPFPAVFAAVPGMAGCLLNCQAKHEG
jgi:hypothetical protein